MNSSKKEQVPIGVLYSLSGTYGAVGREMLNGVLLAVDEINAREDFRFSLAPVILDSRGELSAYYAHCNAAIRDAGAKHVIGCYTSASRKQVLPLIERANVLLWHSARYEGFESSENVIYVGAAPNQHIVPLAQYVIEHLEPRVYCIGSNYIWTWETNRVLREILTAAGGRIVCERLVPLGDTEVEYLVADILARRPAAVFNTLVGEASYIFYRAFGRAMAAHPTLARDAIPMLSCSLCEPELRLIGQEGSVGHVTSSVYFQSIARAENAAFLARHQARFGPRSTLSVDTEAAYLCTMLLGRAIQRAGTDDVEPVREAVLLDRFEAPHGPVWVDPDNNHCFLTPRLAVSRPDFGFDIFWEAPAPVKPDPYLAWLDTAAPAARHPSPREQARSVSPLRVVK